MSTISLIVGSLRQGSYALKIARAIQEFFPVDWEVRIVDIADLPLYNFDYDDPSVPEIPLPDSYREFRKKIAESDGIFFVTPENNRLIPACLKNAIDIGSKPNDAVAWTGKPVGIITHSVGRMGGYSSQKSLRLALSYFDMYFLGQPEVFLGQSPRLITEDGSWLSKETETFVANYVSRFVELVRNHHRD